MSSSADSPVESPRYTRRPLKTVLIALGCLAVVAVALVAVRLVDSWRAERAYAEQFGPRPVTSEVVEAAIESARREAETLVRRFYDRLAAGDAAGALACLSEWFNSPFLSDDVLKQALPDGVSNLTVTPLPPEKAALDALVRSDELAWLTVEVSYDLAGTTDAFTLRVVHMGYTGEVGAWRIATTRGYPPLGAIAGIDLEGLTFNGQVWESDGRSKQAFPGTYTIGTTIPFTMVAPESAEWVMTVGQSSFPRPKILLTPEGQQRVYEAVESRLGECLASTEANPPGCPFGLGDRPAVDLFRHPIDVASITWSLSEESDRVLSGGFRLDVETMKARPSDGGMVSVFAIATAKDGAMYRSPPHSFRLVVDLSDPDNNPVVSLCQGSEGC